MIYGGERVLLVERCRRSLCVLCCHGAMTPSMHAHSLFMCVVFQWWGCMEVISWIIYWNSFHRNIYIHRDIMNISPMSELSTRALGSSSQKKIVYVHLWNIHVISRAAAWCCVLLASSLSLCSTKVFFRMRFDCEFLNKLCERTATGALATATQNQELWGKVE